MGLHQRLSYPNSLIKSDTRYTEEKISIEHVNIFLSNFISNAATDMQFSTTLVIHTYQINQNIY